MIKAVIFNVTGVICDPRVFIRKSWISLLAKRGVKFEGDYLNMIGKSFREQVDIVNKRYNLSLEFKKFHDEFTESNFDFMRDKLEANPGVKNLIKNLKENNIKLAIASQNHLPIIRRYFKIIDLPENSFDAIVTVEELTKFKPDPQIFEITCEKLGVKPNECVMIDDSVFGFEPAKKLGIKGIGIASTFQKKENLEKVADLVIDSLEELNYDKIKNL